MSRGPAPTPTKLKEKRGNPGKRPLNRREPQPRAGKVTCPAWLCKLAKEEWKRIYPELKRLGLITSIDRSALAAYCQCYARWKEAEEWIAGNGTVVVLRNDKGEVRMILKAPQVGIAERAMADLRRFAQEFGLTPSSRSRVTAADPEVEKDPLELFLGGAG